MLYAFMVSLANRGFGARSSRRLSSTSPWTYSARMILNTLRRERISKAREALHGARSPSKRTPESRNTLGMEEGLPLPIKALVASPTYSWQVLQSLPDRDPSARQGRLFVYLASVGAVTAVMLLVAVPSIRSTLELWMLRLLSFFRSLPP